MAGRTRYKIQSKVVGGELRYMIYKRWWVLPWRFIERCDTAKAAHTRLKELCQ